MIRLTGVSKRYAPSRTNALARFNLEIGYGENISIMGRSGSGKSTLLNLLSGLDLPTEGTITFDGRIVSGLREWTAIRANKIGIVFQHFCLLPDFTARENLEIALAPGMPSARSGRVDELVETFDLARVADQYPPTLSGGERQRVAIARAVANRPALLLADEPTGNLDTASGSAVMQSLNALHANEGCTLILVTHDAALAASANRQIVLADGAIVSDRIRHTRPTE